MCGPSSLPLRLSACPHPTLLCDHGQTPASVSSLPHSDSLWLRVRKLDVMNPDSTFKGSTSSMCHREPLGHLLCSPCVPFTQLQHFLIHSTQPLC